MTTPLAKRLMPRSRPEESWPFRSLQIANKPGATSSASAPGTEPATTDEADSPTSDCDALGAYLTASNATAITLRMNDIERVRGGTLPAAASAVGWWANDPAQAQAQHGWLAAGWRVALVDLKVGTVTFARRSPGE